MELRPHQLYASRKNWSKFWMAERAKLSDEYDIMTSDLGLCQLHDNSLVSAKIDRTGDVIADTIHIC